LEGVVEEFKGEGMRMSIVKVAQRKVMLIVDPCCWEIAKPPPESERKCPPNKTWLSTYSFHEPLGGGLVDRKRGAFNDSSNQFSRISMNYCI